MSFASCRYSLLGLDFVAGVNSQVFVLENIERRMKHINAFQGVCVALECGSFLLMIVSFVGLLNEGEETTK